jgi:predicted ATPase
MRRFILTGAPGAGKTAIIRRLELDGFGIVEEAATDVIALEQALGLAEPWTRPAFIDAVVDLQRRRQIRALSEPDAVQFHDRSAICTAALAAYLGYPVSTILADELNRIKAEAIYCKRIFFIRNMGFVTPTEARQISFAQTVHLERVHEETYRKLGFEIVFVEPAGVEERAAAIRRSVVS